MSQTIVEPPLTVSLRRFFTRLWEDPDSRGVLIGLLGMVIFHLLLFFFGPFLLESGRNPNVIRPHSVPRQFSIDLSPDAVIPPKVQPPKPPAKFVETNPNAPDNAPDKTDNFAAQNQQVAQEKPTPNGKNDRPALEGQKDIKSNQIVTGQLTKPIEQVPIPPTVDTPPQEKTVMSTRPEQNPISGFEKKMGEDPSAFGSNIAKQADNAKNIPEKVDGVKDAPLIEGAQAMQPQIDPRRPRPRPQIVTQQQVRPAIFEENKFGTANIGPVAIDAKWSNYGVYLQKMIETVQRQWDQLLLDSRIYPPSGSMVTVKFIMDSEGKIAQVVSVENKATEPAARACVNAITERSPYGPWTDDMKAVLGERQEMTFSFYYQ